MIRPRGGGFVYDAGEVAAMEADIRMAAAAGAHGVVFGALRPDATIDADVMRRLIDRARPLPVTCHKAIDAARDPLEALDVLLALGVDRVLTSGGADTAAAGAATIARMVARAGDALVVMAGGGVRADNVARARRSRPASARCTRGSCRPASPGSADAAALAGLGGRDQRGRRRPSDRPRLSGGVRASSGRCRRANQHRAPMTTDRERRQRRRAQERQLGEHADDDDGDQQPGPDAALDGNPRHLEWALRPRVVPARNRRIRSGPANADPPGEGGAGGGV